MKLAVVTLIRNEIDIIGAFLQHLDALFDYAVLMNHHSIDGTDHVMAQACSRRPGWMLWQVDAIGYHQTQYCAFAARYLFDHTDADVLLFLDADEFINVPDRATLERAFARLTDPNSIGYLRWSNAVPLRFDTRAIQPGEPITRPPQAARLGKVVMTRAFFARHAHNVKLVNGNHGLYFPGQQPVPWTDVGEILHLPIRSHTQIKAKVVAGVFAVMALAGRDPLQCWHWYDILWRIGDGTLRDEDLIGITVDYGEQGRQGSQPMSLPQLDAAGFRRAALNVAFGRPLTVPTDSLAFDPVRLMATILRRFHMEDVRNSRLALDGDRLHFIPPDAAA